ncbi:hypothetical protein BaRGS_00009624 [Batillaria attramentaria]|uniref:Protein kinase domain-containing protein n=1 Tax=Batillaria attramentaria TaxID=370345 RepID=A0ABD0LJB4_9CAEN
MSAWRRDIFKWPRSQSAHPKGTKPIEPLVTIGNVDESADPVAKDLHSAAVHGRRNDLVRNLETGICIDIPNDAGQTPLFCAALRGHHRAVEVLLQNGANPNEKDNNGMTPVHAACLRSSLRLIGALIEYGGDLRLHDNKGNTCLDWAKRQPDPKRRMKMLEFLQKSQLFALNYTGDFSKPGQGLDRQPSILQMLRSKVGSHMSLDFGPDTGLNRVHSFGFGKVYYGGDCEGGVLSIIPLITENLLMQDENGVSFDSTSHLVMESMKWDMTPVTVKQTSQTLHRENIVDLLISEVDRLAKLRHPNILLLMGLCQSTNLDNLMLVFERVGVGSLNHLLYDKMERLPMMTIRDISRQVCDALQYIHRQNFLHCGLSSHAVYLVSVFQAKLGNLEYMVERKKAEVGRSSIVSSSPHREQLYRWMAPEVLSGGPPTLESDIYSYSCVLWEMITSEPPWKSKELEEVVQLMKSKSAQLPTERFKMPPLFKGILNIGLKIRPAERPPDFVVVQQWLQGPIDKSPAWSMNNADRLVTLQREPEERTRLPNDYTPSSESDASRKAQMSKSNDSQPWRKKHAEKKSRAERDQIREERAAGFVGGIKEANSDTNNHYQAAACRTESLHGSWSSLGDIDSDECDAVAGKNEKKGEERRYFWRGMGNQQRQSRDRQPRRQDPLSKLETSGLFLSASQLTGQRRRSANLPWQGSLGLLRAGNSSPRLSRHAKRSQEPNAFLGVSAQEGDCRALPPMKPASHSTDIKAFPRSDSARNSDEKIARQAQSLTEMSLNTKRTEDDETAEKEELTGSNKGSAGSLTTVSARDSCTDEDLHDEENETLDLTLNDIDAGPLLTADKNPAKIQSHSQTSTSGGTFQTASSDNYGLDGDNTLTDQTQDSRDMPDGEGISTRVVSPLKLKGDLSPRRTREDLSPREFSDELSPRRTRDGLSPREARDDFSPRRTRYRLSPREAKNDLSPRRTRGGISPREISDELSPRRTRDVISPHEVRESASPRKGTRDGLSPRKVRDDLAPRRTKDGRSPRDTESGPASRQSIGKSSPRRSRASDTVDHFDFEEYYIDDDYSAEDPYRFDSLCTQGASVETHVFSMRDEWRGGKYRFEDQEIQTGKTSYCTPNSREERRGRQRSPVFDDAARRVPGEESLQSVSDTLYFPEDSDSFNPQHCIVLNLEKRGHTLECSQHQSVDSLNSRSRQSDTADDDTILDQVEERHFTSPRQSTLHKFYLGPNTCPGGFTTTLRVESSLQTPGSHHITHTARDQDTGVTHTVHEETVTATTLRTTLGIQ